MGSRVLRCQVAVIGAGPYGLAAASHLRAAGLEVRTFGKAMEFWDRQMPKGMLLRSPWNGSHIADPERALTLDRYETAEGRNLSRPLPVEDFVRYGQWFQCQSLPDLDPRRAVRIERASDGFRLSLEDGDTLWSRRVIIAGGIGSFANCPAPFAGLPSELVSHTSDRINRDLSRFSGRHVAVVGGGQSAIESAALLAEAGAEVEVLVRDPELRWLRSRPFVEWLMDSKLYPLKAPGKIGPLGINWLIEHPQLFTLFPRAFQDWMATRSIRAAASSWLRPRTQRVTVTAGRHVVSAAASGDRVHLQLDDGSSRSADHVLLGTGYKVAISRYEFLSPELLEAVRSANGYPILNSGFESSVAGLFFIGAAAAHSFGPLCRFVAGTPFTARALTRFVKKNSSSRLRSPNPV